MRNTAALFNPTSCMVRPQGDSNTGGSNDAFLSVWLAVKKVLPAVITGGWNSVGGAGDRNPGGALFNLVFIRIPAILAGCWYAKLLRDGGTWQVDFGAGLTVVSPVVVCAVIFLILGPGLRSRSF